MDSNPSHHGDASQDYAHPVPVQQQTFEWLGDSFYPQTSTPPSGHQSYYHHPGPLMMEPAHTMMEPAHTMTEPSHHMQPHQSATSQMSSFAVSHGMQYHTDAHGQMADPAYQYPTASIGFSTTPIYDLPRSPHSQLVGASGRQSPPTSSPGLALSQRDLADDVRGAIDAALNSREYARGENVPAELLMPTVQKIDKELWECRICLKSHKRRDHTLTHVRTAHLDNKGFRCAVPGCDSAFGRKGDLERHTTSTHQVIDPPDAVCPKCNSQLHRRDNLIRHLKSCRVTARSQGYGPSTSTSRTSRRSDYSTVYQSAPYPTSNASIEAGLGFVYDPSEYTTMTNSYSIAKTPVDLRHSPRTPRHDPAIPQQSLRTPRLDHSVQQPPRTPKYENTVPRQSRTPQAPLPTAYVPYPSDVYYDHTGLGFIDVWHQVAAPYDYPFYDMGNSSMIPPR